MSNARELAEFAAGYGSGSFAVGKNKIINGAMTIDQRNAGASTTPAGSGAGTYTLDRWVYQAGATSKFNVQQNLNSVTPPAGFTNYLGLSVASAVSIGSTDYFSIYQCIEGYNIADLGFGSSDAKTVTLSFWVRSSLTGTFGGAMRNGTPDRTYPFSYTITSANTWEKKTITIAGDTSGTWATNNTGGMYLSWGLGVGSTYSGTAGSWSSANYQSSTGATSVVGTSGATFYITGVQLEEGSVATPFENRLYPQELALCQRYYEEVNSPSADLFLYPINTDNSGAYRRLAIFYKVNKRTPPTVTPTWYLTPGTSRGVNGITTDMCDIYVNGASASEYAALYKLTILAEL